MTETLEETPSIDLEEIRAEAAAIELPAVTPESDDHRDTLKYLRLRARLMAEQTVLEEQHHARMKALQSRTNGLDYVFAPVAERFCREKIRHGKTKSVKLEWGTLGFRTKPAKLVVADEAKVLAAAKANPTMAAIVRMKESVAMEPLKAYVEASGEMPDGVELEPARENFYVK